MSEELLSCPFCGGTPFSRGFRRLECSKCGAEGPSGTKTEAIAAWNRRSPPTHDEARSGWRPIETAPNNTDHMRPILAYWRSRGVQQTYWDVDDDYVQRPRGWRSPESGWRCDGDQCIPVNQEDVTHWMPLPSPPNPTTQAEGGAG